LDAAALRRYYAEIVVPTMAEGRDRIVAAFAAVPREGYVGPGPWQVLSGDGRYVTTPSADLSLLYQNQLVALAEERGINNGSPSAHALWLAAVAPKPGETVVHVGAGTGYYTAILAELVGPQGTVVAYEIATDLAARATTNVSGMANVRVVAGSAIDGTLPSCDVVYVNAAVTALPDGWLDALRPGARLMAPLTPKDGYGGMLLATRRHSAAVLEARFVSGARFIGCVGGSDDDSSAKLAVAFQSGGQSDVRSLRRSTQPDASCWYAAPQWWLSTKALD
jgi:protein-L-isoaspartate(D-aspartate) O-methyltransferase